MNTEPTTAGTLLSPPPCSTVPAISLWQPWASALFALRPNNAPLKPDETRHWPLPQRFVGVPVAIHAALRNTREEQDFWRDNVLDTIRRGFYGEAFARIGVHKWSDLPRGCIIGVVVFRQCWRTTGQFDVQDEIARVWGNYAPGRYAWPVATCAPLDAPVPYVGRQGFFSWSNVEMSHGAREDGAKDNPKP